MKYPKNVFGNLKTKHHLELSFGVASPTSIQICRRNKTHSKISKAFYLKFNEHYYWFTTLRVESSQTNVILQYKLLASILGAVCSVIQQSQYIFHFHYTLYDGKYDCRITMHQTIFQLQHLVQLNNHQYNCNITKSFLRVCEVTSDGKVGYFNQILILILDNHLLIYLFNLALVYITRKCAGPGSQEWQRPGQSLFHLHCNQLHCLNQLTISPS